MNAELAGNVAAAMTRLRTAPCIDKRLDEIVTTIDDAAKSGNLPPIGAIGRPTLHLWGHGTWDSAVASETTSHFPAQRLANFVVAYQFITRIGDVSQRELQTWSELWTLVGPGRPIDSSTAQAARVTVSRGRFFGREMGVLSQCLLERFKALNLPPLATPRAAQFRAQIHQPAALYEVCQPIGKQISPNYGRAPLDEGAPAFEKALQDLPQLHQ